MGPSAVRAQVAPSACDPEYLNTLEARAWLEAQREITQNQNLIYKPDSVLSYTCFNKFGQVLANMQSFGSSQGLFSETMRWGQVLNNQAQTMDTALGGLITSALTSYFTGNFSHNYLGGRESGLSVHRDASMQAGGYTCNQMAEVWQRAKCYNFQPQDRPEDGFFTFRELSTGNDKRTLPSPCANPTQTWTQQMQRAGIDESTSGPAWAFDRMTTYFERLDPANCGGGGLYSPLPTGIRVYSAEEGLPVPYPEHVCIMPGCFYDARSNVCTTSTAASPGP